MVIKLGKFKDLNFQNEWLSEQSYKDEVLNKMRFHLDEPTENDLHFGFLEHAENIAKFLTDKSMVSPFAISIHGEWGSGKTTFVKKIKKIVDKKIIECDLDWHTVEFDAWEYERMDLVSALLQKIQQEYEEVKDSESHKKFVKAIGSFMIDAVLHKTVGMTKNEAENHFKDFFQQITTIKKSMEEIVKDNRLIVFVDDLDRCMVDNVLDMLEAIKMFLTSKNVLFVIAVDMSKIERAWELRHKSESSKNEGREHIEKIFQLTLSLPPKQDTDLQNYVKNKIAQSFSLKDANFFINICPPNPRKIVRMLNQIYYVLSNVRIPGDSLNEQNDNFEVYLPIIMTWSSITTNHPYIAKIVKHSPSYLIQMALLCNEYQFHDKLKRSIPALLELYRQQSSSQFTPNEIPITTESITYTTIEGLEYISKNGNAYKTLRNFGKELRIDLHLNGLTVNEQMDKFYTDLLDPIKHVMSRTMIGI